jgi:hypothetical protein
MTLGIHQPHYFPRLGFLNKMTLVDKFVLLDDVQLTEGSYMYRCQVLTNDSKLKYLTLPFSKFEFKQKKYRDIKLNSSINWQFNHLELLSNYYRKSPFYNCILEDILFIYNKKYKFLIDVTLDTIFILKNIFNIKCEIIMQSEIDYNPLLKKSDLILNICKTINTDIYLSGKGGKNYLNLDDFNNFNIQVDFQDFIQVPYTQFSSSLFIPGLSSIDNLFNTGKNNLII